jgi:hypothetical protein
VAVVSVKKDAALTAEALTEYSRANLTGYKVPKHVYFRTELPKTNVGKILRRALRDELRAGQSGGGQSAGGAVAGGGASTAASTAVATAAASGGGPSSGAQSGGAKT